MRAYKAVFPSTEAAAHFAWNARENGWKVKVHGVVELLPRKSLLATWLGLLIGAVAFGLIAVFAEAGFLGLPGIEPIFASPVGGVTVVFLAFGGGFGAFIASLLWIKQQPPATGNSSIVEIEGAPDEKAVQQLAKRHGGSVNRDSDITAQPAGSPNRVSVTPLRWMAWGLAVVAAAVVVAATSYIWLLSAVYGPGADQGIRLSYTLKNSQRIPASTPEGIGLQLAEILGGPVYLAPDNPIATAILAPIAASTDSTIVYGSSPLDVDLNVLAVQALGELSESQNIVVVSANEPAYAMPAAYAAAHFEAPVIPVFENGLSNVVRLALEDVRGKSIFIAAPERLIGEEVVSELGVHGRVRRVANENIYEHALAWVRGRWGDFGWGMNERWIRDGYYYPALANPEFPELAAAGLPMAYRGNYGPLFYTPREEVDPLTDQYFWRVSPKFFVIPTEGPFHNFRVLGGPNAISYHAQARADFAVETHPYRDQVTGMSGLAALGWAWYILGFFGALWGLFIIPRVLPESSFYPRLYWPLAMLTLGPVGILAFFLTYQKRPVDYEDGRAKYVRPPWGETISATIMSLGMGMTLMIASMYLFQLNGMPLSLWFADSPFFWLGSPMSAVMWVVMVVPAVLFSTFLFMGPMMAEMRGGYYWDGVKAAFPIAAISMVSASLGMFTLIWYWMHFKPLMTAEDLWLWVSPIWWGAALGFITALIPNYFMVKSGWKHGGM